MVSSWNSCAVRIGVSLIIFLFLGGLVVSSMSQPHRRSLRPRSDRASFLFNYQSQGNTISDWVSLFTLCLAPLIAHLVAGVPNPVILSLHTPRWTDRICHYNPTSIIWRYFVIFDRRVRCLNWTAADMAASNAHFWVGRAWDSSEDMMMRSRRFCIRAPSHSYVHPLSVSAAETVIVTLQGVQALYETVGSQFRNVYGDYALRLNLGNVLLPLAILGLLRLPAALWMSQDSPYENIDTTQAQTELRGSISVDRKTSEATRHAPTMRLPGESQNDSATIRFRAPNGIHGLAVRGFYLAGLLALTGFTAYTAFYLTVPGARRDISVAGFVQIIVFLLLLVVTSLLFIFYILRGYSTTTIIPCITSTWYKAYTALLSVGMLVLIILAAVQTRKTWCGDWTMYPPPMSACGSSIKIQDGTLKGTWNNGVSNNTTPLTDINGVISAGWIDSG